MKSQPPAEWAHLLKVQRACWIWQGPTRDGVPVLPRGDRKDSGHRRARNEMLRLGGYQEPAPGLTITTSCGKDLCVQPEHVVVHPRAKRKMAPRSFRPRGRSLDDIRRMKKAHDAGYSYRAIGRETGVSAERVRQLIERYDANRDAEGSARAS